MTTDEGKRTVRTTIKPDQELEVSEAEATDLERQGLLVPGETKTQVRANARGLTNEGS